MFWKVFNYAIVVVIVTLSVNVGYGPRRKLDLPVELLLPAAAHSPTQRQPARARQNKGRAEDPVRLRDTGRGVHPQHLRPQEREGPQNASRSDQSRLQRSLHGARQKLDSLRRVHGKELAFLSTAWYSSPICTWAVTFCPQQRVPVPKKCPNVIPAGPAPHGDLSPVGEKVNFYRLLCSLLTSRERKMSNSLVGSLPEILFSSCIITLRKCCWCRCINVS